ncbi:MAG: FmdB family zinc ribbon protein [Candidatus Margulisiibacteriota bacterium]|jgi:putative FmdB family regulatory protein
MPTYEYKCLECGYLFDAVQSIHDDPLKQCPECQSEVRRLISKNVGIAFKGSGFYVTDSTKSSKKETKSVIKDEKKVDAAPAANLKTDTPSKKTEVK